MQTAEPLIREIDIEAIPETGFEFFVDPAKLTRWLADEATLDPTSGRRVPSGTNRFRQIHGG